MAITINGTGTITGISAGGLPDNCVTAADLATTLDLSSNTVTLPSGAGGKILQVVTTDYTGQASTPSANSWTQVTGLNRTITLSSNSSTVLIMVTLGQTSTGVNASSAYGVTRDGSLILTGVQASNRIPVGWVQEHNSPAHSQNSCFMAVDSPGASGSYTYGVQFRSQGGTTAWINRSDSDNDASDSYAGRAASHITLMEIA